MVFARNRDFPVRCTVTGTAVHFTVPDKKQKLRYEIRTGTEIDLLYRYSKIGRYTSLFIHWREFEQLLLILGDDISCNGNLTKCVRRQFIEIRRGVNGFFLKNKPMSHVLTFYVVSKGVREISLNF